MCVAENKIYERKVKKRLNFMKKKIVDNSIMY